MNMRLLRRLQESSRRIKLQPSLEPSERRDSNTLASIQFDDACSNEPFRLAHEVYKTEPCARTFLQDIEWHFRQGYVYSSPEVFVMGRVVMHDAPQHEIVNPAYKFASGDCWHVYLLSGSIRHAWLVMPFRLRYMSFERNNVLKVYETDQLRRRFKLT